MDKFGIFNILNSLSQMLSKSDLDKSFVEEKKTEPVEEKKPEEKEKIRLKSPLINAMNSHDEFVKRVKAKEGKK